MLASTDRNNAYLLEEVVRSTIPLPPIMAICRHPYEIESLGSSPAALLLSERVPDYDGVWKFHVLERPQEYLTGARLVQSTNDTWFQNNALRILVQRSSSRPEAHNKLFETILQYYKYKLVCDHATIPVIRLHNDVAVLPSVFAFLDQHENRKYRFTINLESGLYNDPVLAEAAVAVHGQRGAVGGGRGLIRSMQSIPVAPAVHRSSAPAPVTALLPQRIVNACIEGMIARGETCPIEMAPLTKETACLTPCGHTMTLSSAECWIRDAHSCPVCRAPAELPQLQRWTP